MSLERKIQLTARVMKLYFVFVIVLAMFIALVGSAPAQAAENHLKCSYNSMQAAGDLGLDVSHAQEGYFGVKNVSNKDAAVIIKGENGKTVYYDLGKGYSYFALPYGSGEYTISLFKALDDGSCVKEIEKTVRGVVSDETYLLPVRTVDFNDSKACVELSSTLRENSLSGRSDEKFAADAASYLHENLSYDFEKLAAAETGPSIPDIDADSVLRSGKCLCTGYAVVFAVMCRSQNIPCKVVYGHLTHNGVITYHAWNSVLLDDEWVTFDCQRSGEAVNEDDISEYDADFAQ